MEKAEHVVTGGIRNSYRKGVTDMKVDRHSKIVELIGKYQIETQEELASYLKEAGYHVTQATVSRDIRELKLTKVQKPVLFGDAASEGLRGEVYPHPAGLLRIHGYGPEYPGH